MGAEQSALLACTQTGKPETPLKLPNVEQFFQLYFDKMVEPSTGPVTKALQHLVMNVPNQILEIRDQDDWQVPDVLEIRQIEEASDDDEHEHEVVMVPLDESVDLPDNGIESNNTSFKEYNNEGSDVELIPLEFVELQPIEFIDMQDSNLEFNQEFVIQVEDLIDEDV